MLTQVRSKHQVAEELPRSSRRCFVTKTGMVISSHRLLEHLEELCHPERSLDSRGLLLDIAVVTAALGPRGSLVTGHRVIGAYSLVITLSDILRPEAGLEVGSAVDVGVRGVQ